MPRCLGGFSVTWVTKLLISPVNKRIFCPKTSKFGPKLAFLSIAGSFGALSVGRLVVVVQAVSPRHIFTLCQFHAKRPLRICNKFLVWSRPPLLKSKKITKLVLILRGFPIRVLSNECTDRGHKKI